MASGSAARILVIEDEPLVRLAIAQALEDAGCVVYEACDAASARTALRTIAAPPDVIILDHRLPDSEDFECLTLVRGLAPAAHVVLITNHPTADLIDGAYRHGATCVLNKPIDLDDLCRRVLTYSS